MEPDLFELRIGDLIEVPDVQTVIDLADVRDLDPEDPDGRVALETLGHTFVITDDIADVLKIILGHFNRREGRGFFIIGNYGSGKSHLLSILSLIARYPWARNSILQNHRDSLQLGDFISSQKLLPVMIPLTEFSGDLSLEKIVWHCAEKAAALAGIPLTLSISQRYIELFNRYVLPIHENEFRKFILTRFEDQTWEQICQADPAAAHTIIVQYIGMTGDRIPFEVTSDRRGLMKELIAAVGVAGWTGILLVVDELSEFLKSKPSSRAVHEDTRFMQFLGEASTSHSLWVAAALQESLEYNQDVSAGAFSKIRARYTHLRLTTRHLHQLISKRLIRHRHPDSDRIIGNIYDLLQNAFSRLGIQKSSFLDLYPIHPDTLALLDQNVDLFSQRRGIVDFIASRVRGRPENLISGILEKPCHELLTPDVIIDHFENSLAQSERYSPYIQLFRQQLSPRIYRHFEDPVEQAIALRTAKILILLAITPFKEKRTIRDLANMVMYRVFDPSIASGDANYAYFEERIIRVLYQSVGFIRRKPGESRLEDEYSVDLGIDPASNIEDRLQRIRSSITPDLSNVFADIARSMGFGIFPLATLIQSTSIRESVCWQNTRRRIAVRLIESIEMDSDTIRSLRKDLSSGKIDFVLLLVQPGNDPEQSLHLQKFLALESPDTSDGWGLIEPILPDSPDFYNALLDIQACRIIMDERAAGTDDTDDGSIIDILKDRKDKSLFAAASAIQAGYFAGHLYLASGTRKLSGKQSFTHFDKWLESVLDEALAKRYPEHHRIAPGCDCQSKVLQDLIFERFILPGVSRKLEPGKDDVLMAALDSVAIPVGLAQKKGGVYHLTATPRKSNAVRIIMEQIPITQTHGASSAEPMISAGRILRNVSSAPYGMSRSIFDLVLIAMIRKGYVNAYKDGRMLQLETLHLPLTGQIDRLRRGDLIPDNLRPAFFRLYKLLTNRNLTDIDLETQENLWKKIMAANADWVGTADRFESVIEEWRIRHRQDPDLPEIRHRIDQIRTLSGNIPDAGGVPSADWRRFLKAFSELDDPDALLAAIDSMQSFIDTEMSAFAAIHGYLDKVHTLLPAGAEYGSLLALYEAVRSVATFSDSLILGKGRKFLADTFERFRNCYREIYIQEHADRWKRLSESSIDSLINSREYQLLTRFDRIALLSRIASIRNLLDDIQKLRMTRCSSQPELLLEVSPLCSCGFTIGSGPAKESIGSIADRIDTQIRYCISLLKKLIELQDAVTPPLAAGIKIRLMKFAALDENAPLVAEGLEYLLDDDLIAHFNRLETQIQPSLSKSINPLLDVLQGRTLTAGEIRSVIRKWTEDLEDLADDEWVRFTD